MNKRLLVSICTLVLALGVGTFAMTAMSVKTASVSTHAKSAQSHSVGVGRRAYRGGRWVTIRVWQGGKWVTKRVWRAGKWTAHKTKRGTKRIFHKSKKIIY